jgi:hypothetical protein
MALEIKLLPIRVVPSYGEPIVSALGLATINWGKMEQHLEILLQYLNDERFDIGPVPKFPDTSFRLKSDLFKKWYARHPKLAACHELAGGICIGLKKANKDRVLLTHSNAQSFSEGPPPTMAVKVLKFHGRELRPYNALVTIPALERFNTLLCDLSDDLTKLSMIVMSAEFRQSLGRDLSRTQRASLLARHILRRLRRRVAYLPFKTSR